MCSRPWIGRAAPERVDALKGEERLGDVRLGEDYGACCAERRDNLLRARVSVSERERREVGKTVRWHLARLACWPTVCIQSCCRTP